MKDLALTAEGMPGLVIGDTRYPLLFSVSAIKGWAEYKGMDFAEALEKGWSGAKLSEEDTKILLRVSLTAGERRRKLFDGGAIHIIDDDLVGSVLDLFHPGELWLILARAWNEPPVKPDPPESSEKEALPVGE